MSDRAALAAELAHLEARLARVPGATETLPEGAKRRVQSMRERVATIAAEIASLGPVSGVSAAEETAQPLAPEVRSVRVAEIADAPERYSVEEAPSGMEGGLERPPHLISPIERGIARVEAVGIHGPAKRDFQIFRARLSGWSRLRADLSGGAMAAGVERESHALWEEFARTTRDTLAALAALELHATARTMLATLRDESLQDLHLLRAETSMSDKGREGGPEEGETPLRRGVTELAPAGETGSAVRREGTARAVRFEIRRERRIDAFERFRSVRFEFVAPTGPLAVPTLVRNLGGGAVAIGPLSIADGVLRTSPACDELVAAVRKVGVSTPAVRVKPGRVLMEDKNIPLHYDALIDTPHTRCALVMFNTLGRAWHFDAESDSLIAEGSSVPGFKSRALLLGGVLLRKKDRPVVYAMVFYGGGSVNGESLPTDTIIPLTWLRAQPRGMRPVEGRLISFDRFLSRLRGEPPAAVATA